MHRAVYQRCPSLLSLFQKYYIQQSICFLENGSRLVNASEGARMGCKLSSFGFSLTVQDIYEKVQAILSDDSCVKAATDDCVIFIKATRGDEARLYAKVKEKKEKITVE